MTGVTADGGKIDIGRVVSDTFQVIGRNIAVFGVLGLLLSGLPFAILSVLQAGWVRTQLNQPTFDLDVGGDQLIGGVGSGLVALVSSGILQGALIHATVQDLSGAKPTVFGALAMGLRSFLPLLGVGFLFAFAVVCGLVLFIVPGLMIICAWCIAAPVLVADRTGVFGAFRRAADLTRGNRWSIFGLLVVFWIITLVLGTVFNVVLGVSAFGADPLRAAERLLTPVGIVVGVVRQTITTLVISAAAAALYVELRRARDGLGAESLREIFA